MVRMGTFVSVIQCFPGLLTILGPLKQNLFGGQLTEGLGYFTVVLNKSPVVPSQPQEALHSLLVGRHSTFLNSSHLFRIGLDAFLAHDVFEIFDGVRPKEALRWLQLQICSYEGLDSGDEVGCAQDEPPASIQCSAT